MFTYIYELYYGADSTPPQAPEISLSLIQPVRESVVPKVQLRHVPLPPDRGPNITDHDRHLMAIHKGIQLRPVSERRLAPIKMDKDVNYRYLSLSSLTYGAETGRRKLGSLRSLHGLHYFEPVAKTINLIQ